MPPHLRIRFPDTMNYLVVLIATRWGSSLGGINVFNTGLASGVADVLHSTGRCVCFVQQMPDSQVMVPEGVELRTFSGQDSEAVTDIVRTIEEQSLAATTTEVVVVGHDVKTGQLAIDTAKRLREITIAKVSSATVSHMDYIQYANYKGSTTSDVTSRYTQQREVVSNADFAFAVGPLLQQSFQVARAELGVTRSRVEALIPGAPRVTPSPADPSGQLRIFISGRLGGEDDAIKNGALAKLSLTDAYKKGRPAGASRWQLRGLLTAVGIQSTQDGSDATATPVNVTEFFQIQEIPYSENQAELFEKLRTSHIALMPSWHEGFGLTGWEALCSGVPLVCSRQSGLAHFLSEAATTIPNIGLESVRFVDLVGTTPAGEPSSDDRAELSNALLDVAASYEYRKSHALKLAERLNTVFTWVRCASHLLEHCGWVLPTSDGWRDRQQIVANPPTYDASLYIKRIDDALAWAAMGKGVEQWQVVCTGLNAFSNLGKSADLLSRSTLREKLNRLCESLSDTFSGPLPVDANIATCDTGRMDLCWRLMAAAAGVAKSFSEFSSFLKPALQKQIFQDSFLRREYFFYACKFSKDFAEVAEDLARDKFAVVPKYADDMGLQVRLARLSIVFPSLLDVLPPIEEAGAFKEEYEICTSLEGEPWQAIQRIGEMPSRSGSLLALEALRLGRQSGNLGHLLSFFEHYQGRPITTEWRGDKRLKAALLTASVSPDVVFGILQSLASDEEEAVRWAAVDIIFSPILRQRLVATIASEKYGPTARHLMRRLGEVVDTAVMFDGSHPWLQREFINLFTREHISGNTGENLCFTLDDFPRSRWLFGPAPGALETARRNLHPEVLKSRAAAKPRIKRVLLVLPPIQYSDEAETAVVSQTSTPPLGIGMLASYLASLGHDVHIADCHRFPALTGDVVEAAQFFDVVGFNVVISTIRSSYHFLTRIKRSAVLPVVVIGGPAANLGSWAHAASTAEELRCWDFQITTNPEENLAYLVSSLDDNLPWNTRSGVSPNLDSSLVVSKGLVENGTPIDDQEVLQATDWRPLVMLDRRLFRGPSGYYEPNATRATDKGFNEAHVVMSRGCDWNCTFCTERRDLSKGEKRRSCLDVISEIRELSLNHANLQLQFIDDNLLPQIAAPENSSSVKRAIVLEWVASFLEGLMKIRRHSKGTFGWRGIFRVEDFLEYERVWSGDGFIKALTDAGCRMLAFGVEHGDEERRRKLKVSCTISNHDIVALFARLKEADIHTKAYFMLGGRGETTDGLSKTIAFSMQSGATLAYFALFKEFVPAVKALRQEPIPSSDKHSSFLDYKQYQPDWDATLVSALACETQTDAAAAFSKLLEKPFSESEAHSALQCFSELTDLGFSFKDLVKYNDYHSDEGPANSVLSRLTGGPLDKYLSLVNEAYLRFYLRPEFVVNYRALIADGY